MNQRAHTDLDDEAQPRNDAARASRQAEAADWKWLMSTKQGRRIAHRLLAEAGIHRTSFTGNSETFFREGRRDFGLFIERAITANAFDSYLLMLTEARAKTE